MLLRLNQEQFNYLSVFFSDSIKKKIYPEKKNFLRVFCF